MTESRPPETCACSFRERFGNPYAVVHRGDLHGVFQRACRDNPRITLRTGCAVTGYEQDGSTVTVRLFSGETMTGSMLIGADGMVRHARLAPTAAPG